MGDGLGFLIAVYRDGRVHIGGKSYPAGTFAVHLLNQYYKDDTAARIAVFRQVTGMYRSSYAPAI